LAVEPIEAELTAGIGPDVRVRSAIVADEGLGFLAFFDSDE